MGDGVGDPFGFVEGNSLGKELRPAVGGTLGVPLLGSDHQGTARAMN